MKNLMTLYKTRYEKQKECDLDLSNYVGLIRNGFYQDGVIKGRLAKQSGDIEKAKAIKNKQAVVTGSAVMKDGEKTEDNIQSLNGLLLMDMDKPMTEETFYRLKNDKYTRVIHKSFGNFDGTGYCLFVEVNPAKDFRDSFIGLAQYYLDTYGVVVDPACSNPNRLRYMSYDPDIYENPKSSVFTAKNIKKQEKPKNLNFVYTKSDFDNILEQIREKNVDLCKESYDRYVRIGMAIAEKFGDSGEEYFHFICQFGSKYRYEDAKKDYAGFCKRSKGKCTISTLYYYCKEFGIDLYSEKTKQIINRVKISKAQGKPTVDSVAGNMLAVYSIEVDENDRELIKELIDSNIDYSKEANKDKPEIEQLEEFIVQTYKPRFDVITNVTTINENDRLSDKYVNDIYINCKKNFDFNVSKADIVSIMNSSAVEKIDVLKHFFDKYQHNEVGHIEAYARAIIPESDYNVWAFTKWIVGAVHNWTASEYEKLVCPLTLVLTGTKQGTGKTSFFRNMLPLELESYLIQDKIDGKNKDSVYNLCSSLMVFDDEFGGKAVKDVKEYKAISDVNQVSQRRPYGREVENFKRKAILCGTSNEKDILKDVTGNRRILPINVEATKYDEIIAMDKRKLIVEAKNMLNEGFDWIIRTDEDIEYLKANTEGNNQVMPAEELFFSFFSIEQTKVFSEPRILNQGELVEYFSVRTSSKITKFELRDIMTKNNLEYKNGKINGEQKKGLKLFCKYEQADGSYQNKPDEND